MESVCEIQDKYSRRLCLKGEYSEAFTSSLNSKAILIEYHFSRLGLWGTVRLKVKKIFCFLGSEPSLLICSELLVSCMLEQWAFRRALRMKGGGDLGV